MANLFHAFVSGGSNNLWDSVLPLDYWNARNLVVGSMCLAGHLEAKPFNEADNNLFRDLVRIKEIDLPTPTLIINHPDTVNTFLSGGSYALIFTICVYSELVKDKSLLGIYNTSLVYIPSTANRTENHLSLTFRHKGQYVKISDEGYTISKDPEVRGQSFYIKAAELERNNFINLSAVETVEKLTELAKKSLFLKYEVIKAQAK